MTSGYVIAVDKPLGPTSHDVVMWARRALGTRRVGHAGTLDPQASGVLVLAVDEATKLVPYLTLDSKTYDAAISLGTQTDTLDAAGHVVATAPVPTLTATLVHTSLAEATGLIQQEAPAFSAIKQGGVRLHELARRGEDVDAPVREVELRTASLVAIEGVTLHLRLDVSKGFYVRSFARDFAARLGTVGSLTGLRRVRSGAFSLDSAIPGDALRDAARSPSEAFRSEVMRRAHTMIDALGAMPRMLLSEAAERDVRHGKRIEASELIEGATYQLIRGADLVAIGVVERGTVRVARGFVAPQP